MSGSATRASRTPERWPGGTSSTPPLRAATSQANPSYAVAYENLGDLHAKQASQAYAKAVQLDANGKSAKLKLALANDLLKTPAKPAGR